MAGTANVMKTQFYEDGPSAFHVGFTLCKSGAVCAATLGESSFHRQSKLAYNRNHNKNLTNC